MQLQIYLWHKMSFKQQLKSGFTLNAKLMSTKAMNNPVIYNNTLVQQAN